VTTKFARVLSAASGLATNAVPVMLPLLMDYDDPRSISAELDKLGFAPQKRFGQNFMINRGAREKIVALAGIGAQTRAWEVGPGLGALTELMAGKAKLLRAFEVDRGYIEYLKAQFGSQPGFELVEGDVLKSWLAFKDDKPDVVVGNLPYNVASGLIADFLSADFTPKMVVTIQKEVGQRMAAKPGTDNYSSFSILCQVRCKVQLPMTLRPGSFWPAPDVTSAVVVLTPRPDAPDFGSAKTFDTLLRALFAARRKTINNNLKASTFADRLGLDTVLDLARSCGIKPEDRAERLTPETVAAFSKTLSQQ